MILDKVLLVEDDIIDRKVLQRFLRDYEDQFQFFYTGSFFEAETVLKTENIKVIVTDYHLGDGEGLQFLNQYKDIPLLIITGANDVELAVTSMKAGAYDFLIKDEDRSYLKMIPVACLSAINRKEQENLLSKMIQAVEQSPSLIMITNKEGLIEYSNPKLTEVSGYSQDELIGQKPNIFHSGHQDNLFYQKLWDCLLNGQKWSGEFFNKNKDGSYYWEAASIAPLFNNSGVITHYVKVGEDITLKKKAEEEKLYTEKLKSILEIAGTVSHEMNQPLQIILGHCELLNDKADSDPSLKKSISTIITNVERIVDITSKIRTITEYKTRKYIDDTNIIDLD